MKEKDLGWLGGIIDGEGCIMVKPYDTSKRLVRVTITNTDVGLLSEVERILGELGVFYTKRMRTGKSTVHLRQCYNIEINRQNETVRFLEVIKPYMQSKDKLEKIEQLIAYVKFYKRVDGKNSNRRKVEHAPL